jgi:AbrB family looped-hinge helix DNA binding protein
MSTERQIYNLKVDPSGRIVLPAQTRERLNISGGDTVVIVEDESGVHLKTRDQLLAEAQAYFASFVPRGVLLSDEVNADRRSEVERDS